MLDRPRPERLKEFYQRLAALPGFYVRSNGALEIRLKDDQTVQFEKPGLDGRKVWE